MKSMYLIVSVLILIATVLAMPQKVSLTPLSSEEDYGSIRGNNALQNLPSLHERYQMFVIAPAAIRNDERQRHAFDTIRGSNVNDLLSFLYSKRIVDKRSLDSIGGGHLI